MVSGKDIFYKNTKKKKEFPKNLLTKGATYIIMVAQYEKRKVLTMRKLLAVLLAAIMLIGVLAALPASAATVRTSEFDGTTSDYRPELLITEILVNSKTGDKDLDDQMNEGDVATWFSPDAFDYVEIYNASSTALNLYDYTIVRSKDSTFFREGSENLGLFTGKLRLGQWTLQGHPDAPNAAFNNQFDSVNTNPDNGAWLEPGEFAVIWFYGSGTMQLTSKLGGPIDADDFRTHYGMSEDTMVIAVPGMSSNGPSFDLAPGYTYALVRNEFVLSERAVTSAWSDAPELTLNGESVVCMFDYILRNAVGIYSDANMDDMAAYYVPANCKPEPLNAVNWKGCVTDEEKAEYVELNDYVEAEFTQTYRSAAILSYAEAPSPGTMPAWQWAYVDPIGEVNVDGGVTHAHGLQSLSATFGDGAAYEAEMKALVTDWATNDAIKGTDGKLNVTETADGKITWSANCVNALVTAKADAITGDGGSNEVKIDYSKNFVSRDELERRHNLKQQGKNEEKGLPIWALILIIVGGVVLVAGIAVVVIIIIKKKNKPVAADDVAAEGEIQIVDETQASETPVDEVEVSEEPADKTEE